MKIEKFDELLSDYNSRLDKISKDDITYKISVENATIIFFKKINKIDKSFINYYFKNINKQNIEKNEIQKYALNYLSLLLIKHSENSYLFSVFFPEYIEKESLQTSHWLLMRWLNIFISWIFKPKDKLLNSLEAKKLLNALKNIKARVTHSENNLIVEVDSELENYNSLSFVVEKLLENKIPSLIYNPINKNHLDDAWQATIKNKIFLENNVPNQSRAILEIDSLLKYLNKRIKLLSNLEKRKLLLKELNSLKSFVYNEQFLLFNEKADEIIKIINADFMYQDTFKISGIYHLIEGIKQRLKWLSSDTINQNVNNQQGLTPNFKDLFYFTIDKIQFYFEHYKENLDKQTEKCFINSINFYNILNRLEGFLYININLCDRTFNQIFDKAAYIRLSLTLALLQHIAKDLKEGTEAIDSKLLQHDITELSQFINDAISPLQIALKRTAESSFLQNELVGASGINEEFTTDDEDDVIASETDENELDISETLIQLRVLDSQALGQESPQTNPDNQSDSGISDEEERHLNYRSSNCQHTSFFGKTAINPSNHEEQISQQILVN